jgi:CheY-like chemotaxis protein
MNGIIGMTELALGSQLTPYQTDCLHTVKTSAQNLLTILNDVLDFSKIESRKLTLEAVPFALAEAMGDVLKLLAIRARQKGIELLYDVDPRTPPGLVGDPVRLRQIVTNLVGNAIKFTDRGRVVLSIHEETRHERRTTLHFSVLDTGIGIPGDKHAAIFEAFSQADGSTTRRFGGTGLGLAISSTLVQMMGGRIWVESEPDAGSVFHFTAAFEIAPETAANVARAAAGPAAAKRRVNVLVAEDNLVNQRVVSGLLSKRGHLVTLAGNGLEAIAALERGQFDVVLMDVQMPEMGGFEATAAIRARERDTGSHIRIVAMTAHAMSGDRERCIASGMDGYLSKPIDMRMLFTIVEENAPPVLGSDPHAMTTGRLRQTAT